jgi:DNA-directed RNA polymerase
LDLSQADRERRLLAEGREKLLAQVMHAEKSGNTAVLPYSNFLVRQVITDLSARIEADAALRGGAGAYKKFALYLGSMDPNIVALRALQGVLSILLSNDAADSPQPIGKKVAHALGRSVYVEYLMTHFAKLSPPLFNSLLREHHRTMTSDERRIIKVFQARFQQEGYTHPTWPHGDIEMVGNYLMQQLRDVGFIELWTKIGRSRGRPHTFQYVALATDVRSSGIALMETLAEMPRQSGPLIEAPKPWDALTNTGGGFHTPEMQRMMAYAVQGAGIREMPHSVIEGINYLQSIAWQVNKPVLDAVRAVSLTHDIGKDITGADPGPMPEYTGDTDEEKKAWKRRAKEWYTERKVRAVRHRRVQKAFREGAELSSYSSIWFAYYADFRGRIYARAGGVSPQGTDLEKGLIRFASGKPLGTPDAVWWFKAHGASKFGLDKISFEDRVRWVDEQHDALLRMAADPIGERAWAEADSPVQFLAWVLEYSLWANNPATFESHLPVSLDGTCNGLQNFSALLRDDVGGRAVNLIDGARPNDIYADVAKRATELLEAMPPSPFRDAWLAHGLNRKVTKRTTMTLPYGCTRFACSEFIVSDYLEVEKPPQIALADYGEAGNFLSHVVWAAIGDVVIKAREAMEWLKGWAAHAAKNGRRVEWTTPSGLLVRSEYPKQRRLEVKSIAFKSRITLYRDEDGSLDARRVANAVAPNFVHSLDASHLIRVVNTAQRRGMTVAAVHDDFGAHAADTAEFSKIIREEFIRMYAEHAPLQALADATGYPIPPPAAGLLDLNSVRDSRYFFA